MQYLSSFSVTFAVLALAACGNSSGPIAATPAPPAVVTPVLPAPGAAPSTAKRTRYSYNNQCVALLAKSNGRYVAASGASYAASAAAVSGAEAFYLKPSALGQYLIYNRNSQLVTTAATPGNQALSSATDAAIWTLKVAGDTTAYPAPPKVDSEPTPTLLNAYRAFVDPNVDGTLFTLAGATGAALTTGSTGALTVAAANGSEAQQFMLVPVTGCAAFPEADSNVVGETFKGTQADGRVLGFADVHNHISATTFLGGVHYGSPFHKFGVSHAVGNCEAQHGEMGSKDAVGALFVGDMDGHATEGWPTFADWPAPRALTHEATYWKWIERAYMAGLRVLVNDLVENETLCESQRNTVGNNPALNCNESDSVMRQVGTMYAMQDYIDAQFGGRGQGWWRIVHGPAEARREIAAGKLAVVMAIENSHLFNCKLTYSAQRAAQGLNAPESANTYGCSADDAAPNALVKQLDRVLALGVRQVFPIHEYDNAFGGNGIFDTTVLNVGNRTDTGGIPASSASPPFFNTSETPTGEFWSTYDCPSSDDPVTGGGYLFRPGANLTRIPPGVPQAACLAADPDGRPGGTNGCYPEDPNRPQCNARWLTPIGQKVLTKLMEHGVIIELDHMELEIKSQTLDLAAAQTPPYPTVSTHSGQGGISNAQARRILKDGGIIYPIKRNAPTHIDTYAKVTQLNTESGNTRLFGYGYGADTNGLATQPQPRRNIVAGREIVYPFTLFKGGAFEQIEAFKNIAPVTFNQPAVKAPDGRGRTWHLDVHGAAHYGMVADGIQEMMLEGSPQLIRDTYNSAEVYLQMWERTEAAGAAVKQKGIVVPPGLLRDPPPP